MFSQSGRLTTLRAFRCDENLMLLRNRKVAAAMRKKYRDLTLGNHSLEVHCVSNAHYARHLEGYDEDYIPITISSTGIPALRAFSLQLPALSKFSTLKQHCEGPLPSFIGSLEMWSMKSASKRRTELRQIIIKPREVFSPLVRHTYILTWSIGCWKGYHPSR